MSTWIKSLFGGPPPPEVPMETQVRDAYDTTNQTANELQEQYNQNQFMIDQLAAQCRKHGNTPVGQQAFSEMKMLQRDQATLAGKIRTLSEVGSGVRNMQSNVAVHSAMVKANAASERIGTKLDVKTVDKTMDATRKHAQDHKYVSDALSGGSLLDPEDPDEMADEMAAFLGEQDSVAAPQPVATTQRMSASVAHRQQMQPQKAPVLFPAKTTLRGTTATTAPTVVSPEKARQEMILQHLARQQQQQAAAAARSK